jgi:hypothetical protein
MDLKAICNKIAIGMEKTAEAEIDLLQQSIAQLMLNLGAILPKQSEVFVELTKDMENKIQNSRFKRRLSMDVNTYFRGNGPIAIKLKEHLDIAEWMNSDDKSNVVTETPVNTFISCPTDMFDFKPTNDPFQNNRVNSLISSLRYQVTNQSYATTKEPLPTMVTGNLIITPNVKTGLYGDGSDSENLTLILRGTYPENEMEVLFYMSPESGTSLWFYHPYEMVWINSDFRLTFDQTFEILEKEFAKANDEASPIYRNFSFDEELIRLEKQANAIFDNEEILPSRLFNYSNGVTLHSISNEEPFGTYVRVDDASTITVVVDKVSLVFRNTKGKYPQRSKQMCRAIKHISTKVDPQDMSRKFQEQMIYRTGFALSSYIEIIRNHK